jgi:N-methylhydantoinase A
MSEPQLRVATDVGGTFTDLVCFSRDPVTGRQVVRTAKADTTPPDFERGVLDVLDKGGLALAEVAFMAHGTTVIINALTERKGAHTGLITTRGFRDVLEIARGNRPDFFNLNYVKPAPFVPRHLRRELPGRMDYRGHELEPLDLAALPGILDDFRAAGVEAVAICLLHAYANTAHEQAVLAEVRRLWPQVSVVASHQITREWREYERSNTAVLSAYVQPVAERYLDRLTTGLGERGYRGPLYIMQSNCGVETVEATRAIPITMVESGPASGFLGAAALGRLLGEPNVLALDIGGTTAKCALIENGEVTITSDYWIERTPRSAGYPIMVPVVDLVEIGNGGGSIAWVDDFGKLHVGPQSAGASPGPAAYGRGGQAATTTDANLALGRINPEFFCGGSMRADMAAVDRALDALGGRLGLDRTEVARGILRLANNNMVNALKLVSLNRGRDPRDFTLVVFGGGGAMHGTALAAELGIRKVIVPAAAGVFSAFGMLMSDLRRDFFVTRLLDFEPAHVGAISALMDEVGRTALQRFAAEGIAAARVHLAMRGRFRYQNQEHAVEVPLPAGPLDVAALREDFHRIYQREYSYRLEAPVEFVGLHLVATAEVGKLTLEPQPVSGRRLQDTLKGVRSVDFLLDGVHPADIYDGDALEPGMRFRGPAVIEQSGTTTVVHPGQHVHVDEYGNIHIQLEGHGA